MRFPACRLALVALGVIACPSLTAAEPAWPPAPCQLEGLDAPARCGTYEVWENRTTKAGRRIGLKVIVVPATAPPALPDPIFFFAGGPGDAIASHAAEYAKDYAELGKKRDLVFIDQRGTGGSNRLDCTTNGSFERIQGFFEPMFTRERVETCRRELERVADLTQYHTSIAMDDIDEVRAALGYAKINLSGGSYGTRAAQVYLRRHAEHVRSAVLFGVAGMNQLIPLHHAPAGKRSLDMTVDACLADAACKAAFPALRTELAELAVRLERAPASATVPHPKTGEPVTVTIGKGAFFEQIRFLLYQPRGVALVPLVLHRAHQGDFVPFARFALLWEPELRDLLDLGMNLSVTCAEDVPFFETANPAALLAGTYLGDYRSRAQSEACSLWPRGQAPAGFHEPVTARVPVLLVSGDFDSVTPPHWAEEAAKHLPLAKHVLVPHGSHGGGGLSNADCLAKLERSFLEQGSAEGLDTSCVETMKRPPFALDVKELEAIWAQAAG